MRVPHTLQIRSLKGGVDNQFPGAGQSEWRGMEQVALACRAIPKAAPLPLLCPLHQPGPKGVRLHVAHDRQQMAVPLNCLGPIAALKHVAKSTSSGTRPKIAGMFTLNEEHVRRNFLQILDSQNQVKVVRHEAIREKLNTKPFPSLSQQHEKRRVVQSFWKDDAFVVASYDNVKDVTGMDNTALSGYGDLLCGKTGAIRMPQERCDLRKP